MRGLSAGAMLSALLIVAVLLWGPLSESAVAQSGITIGMAVDGAGLAASSEMAEVIGRYLEGRLSIPVKVHSFASEAQLYKWLTSFNEVDVAWLSNDFLAGVPAGQLSLLIRNQDHSTERLRGAIVARPLLNSALRQQMVVAFLKMHENTEGQTLLSQLGVSGFVAPEGESPSATLVETATPVMQRGGSMPAAQVNATEEPPPAVVDKEDRTASSPPVSPNNTQNAPIALAADYLAYNSEEDSYEAKGDVVLHQGGIELKTDALLWQSATQDAAAQGSVVLNDIDTEISAERLQYNMATGQGQIHNGQVFVREGNFHLAGEQIEKRGQAEYFVKQGSFTTCDGEIPDWKFSASEVDVTLGGYARAKHVWFHVKDVPVLYTPYLMFPVKTERESGFLMPSFGYSNNKGTRASLAWYQVIDRNMDATLYLDYLSEIGLSKGIEYRYALANQNNGKMLYYHVTGFSETPNLYYLEWEHRGKLPGDWHLAADVEYANKQLFFEEFGEVAKDYNRDKTVATLMLQRNWQKLNLVGHARYTKDLEADNDGTLQRLPELGLGLAGYRIGGTPLYASLESYATRFSRDEGEDGERLFLKPSLSAVFTPGSWLEIVPQIAFYERLYNVDDKDDEMFVPEFSLGLATRLVKSFDVESWGINRLQHSVEPKMVYTYTPDESQDELPLFDLHDRTEPLKRNAISYALINRLTARSMATDGSSVYRELLNLRLSQSYDIDEARNNQSGKDQPFSDVRIELDFRPTPKIAVDLDSWIPVYGDTRVRSLTASVSVRDDDENALRFDYSYKNEEFNNVATDYAAFQLDTSVLHPVYVRFEERYDFRESRELEKVLGLEYRSKCWSLLLTYRNRYQEGEADDQEVMVTFVLAGLGQNQGFGRGF